MNGVLYSINNRFIKNSAISRTIYLILKMTICSYKTIATILAYFWDSNGAFSRFTRTISTFFRAIFLFSKSSVKSWFSIEKLSTFLTCLRRNNSIFIKFFLVHSSMGTFSHYNKIFKSIIKTITINVVNSFIRVELSIHMFFHNLSMLINIRLAINTNTPISIFNATSFPCCHNLIIHQDMDNIQINKQKGVL